MTSERQHDPSWAKQEFQRRNPHHKPGAARQGVEPICLIHHIADGHDRGCCSRHCPACTQRETLQKLFDHEEPWHVEVSSTRQVLRLGRPYLDQEQAAKLIFKVLSKLPAEPASLLTGYVGPDEDGWFIAPYTAPVIVQTATAPAVLGWTRITSEGITPGERLTRWMKTPTALRHERTLFWENGPAIIEARDEEANRYLALRAVGNEQRWLLVECNDEEMGNALAGKTELRTTILASDPRNRYLARMTPDAIDSNLAAEPYWGPILQDDVLPPAGFSLRRRPPANTGTVH